MILRSFINKISPAIKPLERRLLQAVESRLSGPARENFECQVSMINLAQRHTANKEVCYYRMKWGRPFFPENIRFAAEEEELKLATVKFLDPATDSGISADIWLVKGFLFSITFTESPTGLINDDHIEIIDCLLHKDPMIEARHGPLTPEMSTDALEGWLRAWHDEYGLAELHQPVSGKELHNRIKNLRTTLPNDYLELLQRVNGFSVNGVVVHGIDTVREITLDDGVFIVLAERHDRGAILVKVDTDNGSLLFADYETGVLSKAGTSIRESVAKFLIR